MDGHVTGAQRARGAAHLSVVRRGDENVLRDLGMSGSAKLLFPRKADKALDAVFLNSAGGITGGDRFELRADVTQGAVLRMTTQAAERIYRAMPGAPGRVTNHLTLAAGAQVSWLPQETILFDGAALDRRFRIDMAPDARLVSCETLIFGRAAMGESVDQMYLRDRVDLYRDGALMFADRLRLNGAAGDALTGKHVANGMLAMTSVLWCAPDAAAQLDTLRAYLPELGGVSALADDLVFLRMLAPDGFELRKLLVPLLQYLEGGDLPRPWML